MNLIRLVIYIVLIIKLVKYITRKIKSSLGVTVQQEYNCKDGNFKIRGKKEEFKISKNGMIEFLVKDGQIVASKDLRVSNEFVFYGGEKDGTI